MFKKSYMVLAALAIGCTAVEPVEGTDSLIDESALDETALEIVENLRAAGYPDSEIMVLEDGTVVAGGDAVVTLEASREMGSAEEFRQYRTNNLVSQNIGTICIDGAAFNSNNTLSSALNAAIANYNELNLTFEMVRTNGSNAGCDAEIRTRLIGGSGGSAGFPSGGLPFNTVNIGTGVASFGTAVASHVIAHEIGHCIGFRHSDFFDRSISCGQGGNEGNGGVGANHIPGTPTGAVFNGSLMNSCFNGGSTGEFTDSDVVALTELYGATGGGDGGGGADPNSCQASNACGGRAPGGCFCDQACLQFNDCCSDGPC